MLGSSLTAAWSKVRPDDAVVPWTRRDVDLRDRSAVADALARAEVDVVVHAAAKVGGISANIAHPVEFLADNLTIDTNLIESAREAGIDRFVYFGSSCMYPRDYRQPLVESDVLAAPLEPTNEGYALAKIAGARLCDYVSREFGHAYRTLIPSNLYGPGDHYGSSASHLVAAAIYKAHVAKSERAQHVDVWGDGTARREFTFVTDVAEWVAQSIDSISAWPSLLNIGLGRDYTIREFYEFALQAVGYDAELRFDPTKPAGMAQKLMDSSRANGFGWAPRTGVPDGMADAYRRWIAASSEESK